MNEFYFGLKRDLRVVRALIKKQNKPRKNIPARRKAALEQTAKRGGSVNERKMAQGKLKEADGGGIDDKVFNQAYKIRKKHSTWGGTGGRRVDAIRKVNYPHSVAAGKESGTLRKGNLRPQQEAEVGKAHAKMRTSHMGGDARIQERVQDADLSAATGMRYRTNPNKPHHHGMHTKRGRAEYEGKRDKFHAKRDNMEDVKFKKDMDKLRRESDARWDKSRADASARRDASHRKTLDGIKKKRFRENAILAGAGVGTVAVPVGGAVVYGKYKENQRKKARRGKVRRGRR